MTSPDERTSRPASEPRLHRFAHDAMACTFEAIIPHADGRYAEQAAEAAFAEVDRLENELSRFIPSSDVARINALKAGRKTIVCIEVIEILELAATLYKQTGGAFDITYASRKRVAESRHSQPYSIERRTRNVTANIDDVSIDLGAIGKGYALDRMIELLADWEIHSALVHSGQSTSLAAGTSGVERGWKVAIRDPHDHERTLGSLTLCDRALSGSGRRLHGDHIIDPQTGKPATLQVAAWALGPTAAVSDALATALMIMSTEAAESCFRRDARIEGAIMHTAPGTQPLKCFGKGHILAAAFAETHRR